MPQFKFPYTFNSFSADFKFILERSDFNHHLEDHYHKKYTSSNCKKTYCKFCAFSEWKLHKLKYAVSDKSYSYIRYWGSVSLSLFSQFCFVSLFMLMLDQCSYNCPLINLTLYKVNQHKRFFFCYSFSWPTPRIPRSYWSA